MRVKEGSNAPRQRNYMPPLILPPSRRIIVCVSNYVFLYLFGSEEEGTQSSEQPVESKA